MHKLTRAKLEALVEELVNRTIKPTEIALKDAGLKASDIDEVILVGGQTRMPMVQEKVKNFFGKEARRDVNPDEVQQSILDHRDNLVRRGIEFAHRDRGGTLGPHHSEVFVVFGTEEIFEEEELEAFDFLGEPNTEYRRNPLMHVVQDLHAIAETITDVFKQVQS